MALTALQEQALQRMLRGDNVFLTGNAGTGKSFVLSEFIERVEDDKNLVICAPSGIAALNVGGVTMHRAFHMPLTVCTGKLRRSKVVEAADIIIIDEISMCRMDMFDYVGRAINDVDERRLAHRAKNGKTNPIQLICVGDFYQLPPVLQDKEKAVLNDYYGMDVGKAYAFQSSYWEKFQFQTISLTEIIRQDEPEFIQNLNKARIGDPACISYFTDKSRKTKMKDAVTICGTNRDADAINARALAKLPGRAQKFQSQVSGEVKASDKSAPDELSLKVGARVILLANDVTEDKYRNGTIAEVKALSKTRIDLENLATGEDIKLAPYTWRISKYVVDEEGALSQEEIGTIKQFPLKLAYAVTIHKSQGQTYDMVNLNPRAWDDGQLYVALSRVRSIKKLHLTKPILRSYLITSQAVKNFYAGFDGEIVREPLDNSYTAPDYAAVDYSDGEQDWNQGLEDFLGGFGNESFGERDAFVGDESAFEEPVSSVSDEDQAYFDYMFSQAESPNLEDDFGLPWNEPEEPAPVKNASVKKPEEPASVKKKTRKSSPKEAEYVTMQIPKKYQSLVENMLRELEKLG